MTAPVVSQLRARPSVIRLTTGNEPVVLLRVQVPEVWDTVRVEASPGTPVLAVKEAALAVLVPDARHHEDFMTKLNGWEVLDETVSVADAGARSGSTFLVHRRSRQPVR